jgi:hypothetical protein
MAKRDGRDPSPIRILGAGICPKCGEQMQRYEHSKEWKPLPGRGYFKFWDRCKCGFNRNPPEAYVKGHRG